MKKESSFVLLLSGVPKLWSVLDDSNCVSVVVTGAVLLGLGD